MSLLFGLPRLCLWSMYFFFSIFFFRKIYFPFFFFEIVLSCPNGCSGNGKCLNGTCECNSNSVGLDCSGTINFNCYTNSLTAPSNLLTINVSCNYSINVPNADSYLVRVISIAGNPLIFTYIPSNILYATFSLSNYSSPIVLYSPSISISGRGFGSAVVQYETCLFYSIISIF